MNQSKKSNLSPYEKYLAVYNLVKQYKEYKENPDNKNHSRSLKYILNNEYIVCVGYAELLTTLLNRINIPSITIDTIIDITKKQESTVIYDKPIIGYHERNLVKIYDDKYNIHGIYQSDATWDNDMNLDLYNNCSITFDRKKEARKLEQLTAEDLILDVHNFEEFNQKINFYLTEAIRKSPKKYPDNILSSYSTIYHNIMDILIDLDYPKFLDFYNKYHENIMAKLREFNEQEIKTSKISITLKDIEDLYSDFLTEYASYIIPLSNNEIDNETLFKAASNVKRIINKYTEEQLTEWGIEVRKINEKYEEERYPYIYNPNETRLNYLESRPKTKSRVKTN